LELHEQFALRRGEFEGFVAAPKHLLTALLDAKEIQVILLDARAKTVDS
jgi:hypothetical protein